VQGLIVDFVNHRHRHRAVDGVSFELKRGETLCLVGESGCGKTVTCLSIARLLSSPPARFVEGQILLEGRDVLKMSEPELRKIRGARVSYVFQQPTASLNPEFRIRSLIKDALRLHRPHAATDDEVVRLLKLVGIAAPNSILRAYPRELSGGMQQRVMIAMALAPEPKLLVADEPTTALDVTIQAQILELLANLKTQFGMSLLLVTHNLAIVVGVADRVAVMYAGQIVEVAPARDLLKRPLHPYTRALVDSVPSVGRSAHRLAGIPGAVPTADAVPAGCSFNPRCTSVRPDCKEAVPGLHEVEPDRWVRCPYWRQIEDDIH
jgi:oligopeptide/dipeptide ABC transporter ATP-binding protein